MVFFHGIKNGRGTINQNPVIIPGNALLNVAGEPFFTHGFAVIQNVTQPQNDASASLFHRLNGRRQFAAAAKRMFIHDHGVGTKCPRNFQQANGARRVFGRAGEVKDFAV